MADDDGVIKGATVFRIVKDGTNIGIIIDCQEEEAAQVAYDAMLLACKRDGGLNITVQGLPDTTPMVFEKGVNFGNG